MKKHASSFLIMLLLAALMSGCTATGQPPIATLTSLAASTSPTSTAIPATIPPTASPAPPTATAIPKVLLPVRGLYVQFDRRGYPSEYWSGQAIREFNNYDDVVGHTVSEELSLQLDQMKQMGVNTIAFELRSSASTYIPGPFVPPTCNLPPTLGLVYPQPTALEIENLTSFLDLVQSKGMKVFLRLVNTHMEESPPANNAIWLGTILKAIKDHPALDLVLFEGATFLIDTNGDSIKDSCGIPAEPALWEGPGAVPAAYVKWAISYAHSLGLPWQKLSAEAIVGDYFTMTQTPNKFATDGHFWDPIFVLKGIFDGLNVPNDQRTYALSFYEHRKCSTARGIACQDENPHAWAMETVKDIFDTIGRQNGARVVAPEMGLLNPVEKTWTTSMALESLVWIMQAYGIDGGCFWRWADFQNSEELDPTLQMPVKQRGAAFTYNPVKDVLENLYTQGQANDLSLTPDSIPPVFSSATVSPSEVKNAEPIEISADLGETHLIVTADISGLDPGQPDPVLLNQVSDGVYQATISLNRWNAAQNGTKTVQISAMDFWSNTATSSVIVALNNPTPPLDAVPPDDNFSGKVLDGTKWTENTGGGATIAQDDRLILSTSGQTALSGAGVTTNWNFPGDFDVQVDFQIGAGWASPAHDHLDGAYLDATIGGQDYRITRLRSSNEDKFLAWSTTGVLTNDSINAALNGKYRMVRAGTTLYLLFDIGEGWQELASTSVPAGPAQINLGNGSVDASLGFTTYFEHFQINAGLTTYKP
jgi:hypothetical protein